MTDELNITKMPDFAVTNWFNNSSFAMNNPFKCAEFNVFDNYFQENMPAFDNFNSSSYIPQFNFAFDFKNFQIPNFNWNFSFPKFDFNASSSQFKTPVLDSFWDKPSLSSEKPKSSAKPVAYKKNTSGVEDKSYLSLSKTEAYKKAEKDPNLEKLTGGKGWSVSENSFKTDIPFAKKGTSKILEEVSKLTGEKLVITSALGTGQAHNPHKKSGYDSHHNAANPKLDIRAHGNANQLAEKLRKTGYFSWVLSEGDHVDVQIDYKKFSELV